MKKEYTLSVITEDQVGLMSRVSNIFTRRHINIDSIIASESELTGVHRFIIVVHETLAQVQKVAAQLEKEVEVIRAVCHEPGEVVYQEIAMYKVPTKSLCDGDEVERLIRSHNARLLCVEKEHTIIEKTGHKEETKRLFEALKPYGILEFVRSGRVAISKSMKPIKEYLAELESAGSN